MLELCVCLYTNVLKSVVTVKLFIKPFQNFKMFLLSYKTTKSTDNRISMASLEPMISSSNVHIVQDAGAAGPEVV